MVAAIRQMDSPTLTSPPRNASGAVSVRSARYTLYVTPIPIPNTADHAAATRNYAENATTATPITRQPFAPMSMWMRSPNVELSFLVWLVATA